MRAATSGAQSKFRFSLRTDHSLQDMANFHHHLKPTLLWVDFNTSDGNKAHPYP